MYSAAGKRARTRNFIARLKSGSLGHLEPLSGLCVARAFALTRSYVMKHKALNDALRSVTKMLSNSRLEPGQRDQLEQAKRELTNIAGAGKLDREKIFRSVRTIAEVALEIIERDNP
jgi:hypothetical protein